MTSTSLLALGEDPKVITAVEFLHDVYKKGHREGELRMYLFNRRELTHSQVDRAFKIHYERMNKEKTETPGKDIAKDEREMERVVVYTKSGRQVQYVPKEEAFVHDQGTERTRRSSECEETNNADRPEVSKPQLFEDNTPSFLVELKQTDGQKLIKDFLKTELNYCGVLRCLQDEYYKELHQLANQKKVCFTHNELGEIFDRVPNLLNFHRVFYKNMVKEQKHIGQMFVQVINHFKEYVEYMKDSSKMVDIMRTHIHDKKLEKYLYQIKIQSRRKNDDMIDLLLVPLDRIMDYKEFLDKLYLWADKAQREDYISLGKASRRIGRIVSYIGIYKDGILNRNEMNKIQQFLQKQCNILAPKRRIVRRGEMIVKRANSWPNRKKSYLFFLFSDLLLWTSRKGELQNVFRLRDCKVFSSMARNNPEKKLTIVCTGQQKELLLECGLRRQRDTWFNAIKQGIEKVQKGLASKDSDKISTDEEDFVKYLALDAFTPPGDNNLAEDSLTWEREDSKLENSVLEDDSSDPRHRYRYSKNFPNHAFKDVIGPMDECVSIVSEQDQDSIFDMVGRENYGASMEQLFPNMVTKGNKSDDVKVNNERSNIFSEAYSTEIPGASLKTSPIRSDVRRSPSHERVIGAHSNNSNLSILRKTKDGSKPSSDLQLLEHNSVFSLQLADTE